MVARYRVDLQIYKDDTGRPAAWRIINLDDPNEKHIIEGDLRVDGDLHFSRFRLIPEENKGWFEFIGEVDCKNRMIGIEGNT